jgi:metal-responsive CopG/Arc/MetJ family transcriptional regulator
LQDLDKVAKRRGISRQEAIDKCIDEGIEAFKKANEGS